MKQRVFRFRQFAVRHAEAAMKVSSDAVLLGAWTAVDASVRRIADIGAGCGVIALMMAQRAPQAAVEAIELDPLAAAEAEANVAESAWSDRVSVTCADFAEWSPAAPVDLMVSNPPFFTETLHAPDPRRASARHAGTLSPQELLRRASEILSPGGSLAMITPVRDSGAIELTATVAGLSLSRLTQVITVEGKGASRLLWQFVMGEALTVRDTLTLRHADGSYSAEYTNLVNDFYLWLH